MLTILDAVETQLDPFPYYAEIRQSRPVYYDQERQNWNIFRYADVQRVLSDYATFSSRFMGDAPESAQGVFTASMIATDPPRHRQLRTLVTQAFTPRAVDALAPRIAGIVDEHLQQIESTGRMDAIRDLAYPLPVIVIAELLGIPTGDRERFKEWSDRVVAMADFRGDSDNYDEFQHPAVMEMASYFFNMIEQRSREPGDDLISGLLQAEIGGERLSLPELMGFCALLLVAGNETTTNLIGNALLTFAEQPELWQTLRAEPERLPDAIEEVLRYRSPVQSMFRVTTTEVELGDEKIPAKSPVVAWIGSANHDEVQFPDPERFILDRTTNRHLAFGHGIHYCLGAPLARLEAKIALSVMLERFSSIERLPGRLERLPGFLVYGVRSLPLAFERV